MKFKKFSNPEQTLLNRMFYITHTSILQASKDTGINRLTITKMLSDDSTGFSFSSYIKVKEYILSKYVVSKQRYDYLEGMPQTEKERILFEIGEYAKRVKLGTLYAPEED